MSGTNAQTQSQTQRTNQEEPTKPPFDINTEDSTTQKLLEQFAKERFSKAVDDEDAEPVNFFNGMFDDKDNFQNTPENRNAIINHYGDEFKTWAANQNQNQQEQPQPAKTDSPVKQTDDPYKRRAEIKNTANKFLEQLRATGDPNKASVAFGLQNALTGGNFAEAENILKQNGVIQQEPTQPTKLDNGNVFANKNYPVELYPRNRER